MKKQTWIEIWEKSYPVICPNGIEDYKRMLRELCTWNKPLGSPSTNPSKWQEWAAKKIALKGLILEIKPNARFRADGRTY